MIIGPLYYANKKKTHYVQTNNPTEGLLKKFVGKLRKGFLETCGPTAACSCLAALGYDLDIPCKGGYSIQAEEVLMDWLNDPKRDSVREEIRKGVGKIPGNRIPQFYPQAVKEVFDAKGEFKWINSWFDITCILVKKKAIQMCLKKPGHFIAAVGYDSTSDEIIYNDPWPQRKGLRNGGFNERMGKEEFERNVQNFFVIYWR